MATKKKTAERLRRAVWGHGGSNMVADVRAAYLDNLRAVAECLKPRFQSGELRGYNDADERQESREGRRNSKIGLGSYLMAYESPMFRLARICRSYFGTSKAAAHLVLAVSPSEIDIEGKADVTYAAGDAAATDLIRYARAMGWYRITPGEEPSDDVSIARWLTEGAEIDGKAA